MHLRLFSLLIATVSFLFVPGNSQISGIPSGSQTGTSSVANDAFLIFVETELSTDGRSSLMSTQIDAGFPPTTTNSLFKGTGGSHFWAMAMDYHRGLVYYTDYVANYFGVLHVETQLHDRVLDGLSFGIDGLVVDWYTGNVYITDTELNLILMVDHTFKYLTRIQTINSLVPAKMAIDPSKRSLYWSETQSSYCAIYKSDLAGNNRQLLHNFTDSTSIDEMTIDFKGNRLYWSDRTGFFFFYGRLLSFDLDSPENVTIHFTEFLTQYDGIAPFQDLIYYSDGFFGHIWAYNTTSESSSLAISFDNAIFGAMVAYHSSSQPWSAAEQRAHPCTSNNCEHLCISDGEASFVCACSLGYHLQRDDISCDTQIVGDRFALILDEKLKEIFQVPLDDPQKFSALPMKDFGSVQAVDYDYRNNIVYWANRDRRQILRASLRGEGEEIFVNNTAATAIGIDHVSRNLYFADEFTDAILVSSLNSPNVFKTLHVDNIFSLWKLVVSHTLGKLFWTDWGQPVALLTPVGRVESSNLDGSERLVVANDSFFPIGLTVDEQSNTIFWTEEIFDGIRWFDFNRREGGKLSLRFTSLIVELTSYKEHLYFTYASSPNAHRLLISDVISPSTIVNETTVQPFGPQIFYGLSGIRFIDSSAIVHTGTSTCTGAGESCPQICLPGETARTCVCGHHYVYIAANNTCTQVLRFEDDIPPDFGDTCPSSVVRSVDRCSDKAVVNFTIPVATDESGPVNVKPTHVGEPPFTFVGSQAFSYKAVDGSGNTATCSFLITVQEESHCFDFPSLPENATVRSTSCGSQFGSVIDVSCEGRDSTMFQYECVSNGKWRPVGNPDCYPEPTTTQQFTSAPEKSPVEGSSGVSGGVIAGIVIAVAIVILIGIFLIIRYQTNKWIPWNASWSQRNDDVGLDFKETKASNPYDII